MWVATIHTFGGHASPGDAGHKRSRGHTRANAMPRHANRARRHGPGTPQMPGPAGRAAPGKGFAEGSPGLGAINPTLFMQHRLQRKTTHATLQSLQGRQRSARLRSEGRRIPHGGRRREGRDAPVASVLHVFNAPRLAEIAQRQSSGSKSPKERRAADPQGLCDTPCIATIRAARLEEFVTCYGRV